MNIGKTLFAQLMDVLPWKTFPRIVDRRDGDRYVKSMTCADQFRVMAVAQLTYRESLRDIDVCLSAQGVTLYHRGLRQESTRSTLADANEARDWRIHAEFAQRLIEPARTRYIRDNCGIEWAHATDALDSTTIELCLSLVPWALFRTTTSAVKMHTLRDLRGTIPRFSHISDGKLGDVQVLDILTLEPGAISAMDRGDLDVARRYRRHQAQAFCVTRAKSNTRRHRIYSAPVDRRTGLLGDQPIARTGPTSRTDDPNPLRRIRFKEPKTGKTRVCLPHNVALPAATLCARSTARWQVDWFFTWITPHLRITQFYGHSEHAVTSQLWIAVSVSVLVAIVKTRLNLDASRDTGRQSLSVTRFEKMPLPQACPGRDHTSAPDTDGNQLNLFAL